jgi:hypothetical protein
MADQGQLTIDKVVPALISQLGKLRNEYGELPQTVSSSATKVENAFMQWVGELMKLVATNTLTGLLDGVAKILIRSPLLPERLLPLVQPDIWEIWLLVPAQQRLGLLTCKK